MPKKSLDISSISAKFQMVVSEKMLRVLIQEQEKRKAMSIQEVIRQILADYFRKSSPSELEVS